MWLWRAKVAGDARHEGSSVIAPPIASTFHHRLSSSSDGAMSSTPNPTCPNLRSIPHDVGPPGRPSTPVSRRLNPIPAPPGSCTTPRGTGIWTTTETIRAMPSRISLAATRG
ncbi:hypothetical protein D1007_43872 [Hordeum vulgare]|nr:hypothetical protein D1007_43872 [Hordeum vulgare]